MKEVILISESALLSQEIPADLLNPDRFDLRSVQYVKEILPLVTVFNPKALILDLTSPEFGEIKLEAFMKDLHAISRKKSETFIPVVGLIDAAHRENAPALYRAGVAALLPLPVKAKDLQRELQDLLGFEFRRLERKQVDFTLEIRSSDQVWTVKAVTLNLECLCVQGQDLPLLGTNVNIAAEPKTLPSFSFWAHCWRQAPEGLILRFLNPQLPFLEAIQILPKDSREAGKPVQENAETLPPVEIPDPRNFRSFQSKEFLPQIRLWLANNPEPFAEISSVLKKLTDFEKNMLLVINSMNEDLAVIIALKIGLQIQLNKLLTTATTNSLDTRVMEQTLGDHDHQVAQATIRLQQLLAEALVEGNTVFAEPLSSLKSELHKLVVSMRQTLQLKGKLGVLKTAEAAGISLPSGASQIPPEHGDAPYEDDYGPARYKEKPIAVKAQEKAASPRIKDFLTQIMQGAVVMVLIGFFALVIHYELTLQNRRNTTLSPEDLKTLSTYFDSGSKHEESGNSSMEIVLKPDWNSIDKEKKSDELRAVANKLKVMDIQYAEIISPQGGPVAIYANGEINLLSSSRY